ncbi:MAG: hypothetical protein HY681_10965 [Chloroflexi bacterium]|nr:hypothetical protein [Chloroflexota bacterium]
MATKTDISPRIDFRGVLTPDNLKFEEVADDSTAHDYLVEANGKSRILVAVDNPANQSVNVSLYGAHASNAQVGDAGAFAIGSTFSVSSASKDYAVAADPFPYYIVRAQYVSTPTDTPTKTLTVFVNLAQG